MLAKLKSVQGGITIAGDGRHDSMGHGTKFGAYTIFCCSIPMIIHFALVQVGWCCNYYSFLQIVQDTVNLEKYSYPKCLRKDPYGLENEKAITDYNQREGGRQCGQVVRALNLKSRGPRFKSCVHC